MNFVQVEFLWFLAIVLVSYWAVRDRVWQNLLLVGASSVFYGWIHPWFLAPLYFSATLDYLLGLALKKHPQYREHLLMVSLASNLGILGYFKYFNFFIENVVAAAHSVGIEAHLQTLSILLPVGVSFYTFQTMSYTIDVYRGELEPRRNFLDYLLYVMFFPQLVAGPIERATRLLPQCEAPRTLRWANLASGVGLMLWGGFKKVCIADTVAPFVDKVFILQDPSGPLIWAGAIGFTIQIFADFSGYTDLARGCARLLGFELTENFRSPFLAATTPEFWQRWHISLSFWIRDYIMVPLLGSASKLSLFRFIWATILTFTIIGFWHGASWNFILFGFFHGVWMTVYTLINRNLPAAVRALPWGRPLAVAFHLVAVSIPGSLLFRETHVDRILQHLSKNPFAATEEEWMATSVVLGICGVAAVPLVLSHVVERYLVPRLEHSPWWTPIQTGTWSLLAAGMFVFYRVSTYDFIYFQF